MSFSDVEGTPEVYARLHRPARELIGHVALEVYEHLAKQPSHSISGVLHGSADRDRVRRNILEELTRVEDDRVFGYNAVWTQGARIEAWGRHGAHREIELRLYSSDGIRRQWAPSQDKMMQRVDWIGADTEGRAYVNFANVNDIAAWESDVEPDWKIGARADRYGLQVAAAALAAVQSSWPSLGIELRGGTARQLEQTYTELGETLGDAPRAEAAVQWYASLPNTDFLRQQARSTC